MTASAAVRTTQEARVRLDGHVREMVRWHFSSETGSPFWLDFASKLDFDPREKIHGYDDLRLLGHFQDEWLRGGPVRRWLPKGQQGRPMYAFETGGSTGLPKGVYFSHRQLVLHTLTGMAALASPESGQRFHRGDVYMPLTPMFHVHAWGMPYIATVLGVKQVYPGRYMPDRLVQLVRPHAAEIAVGDQGGVADRSFLTERCAEQNHPDAGIRQPRQGSAARHAQQL